MSDERRLSGRVECFSAGHIIGDGAVDRIRCLVWNMSDTGALVEVGAEEAVPQRFDLVTATDQMTRRCEVIRRTGARLGVAFVG
ncbi:pilus assembly protein PilZ [Methylobacterium symbioticum]|uniref:PilZ domain-containing protein n=1 Tax=Methylobacterium symbioticum TaxID=2584084 RepID=A0A509EH68_9HYPH|nr:pilus assembly protein PilZ [Methylobacterium symbioticum]VUD72795.1 hypothetical protein MET9862_03399 [Methylobacterium symbioticum]